MDYIQSMASSPDNQPSVRPVPLRTYVAAMTERWRELGNHPSAPLKEIWRVTAATYGDAIRKRDDVWRVLQPPTGTGKTQGLCVYAALTISRNRRAAIPIGILIVTRMISQASEILAAIQMLVPGDAAQGVQASHSKRSLSSCKMRAADVLIITHAAFTRGLEAHGAEKFGRFGDYTNWAHGPRLLTIIDEPLAGLIEEYQVNALDVDLVLTCMDGELRYKFPTELRILSKLGEVLHNLAESAADARAHKLKANRQAIMWTADECLGFPRPHSMAALYKAMSRLPYDQILNGKDSVDDRGRSRERMKRTLSECEAITRSWCISYQKGITATLNSGQLLIPPDLPGPVVLDATATENFLWTLMGRRALLVPIPEGARNYRNVSLHVARVPCGLGKGSMRDKGKTRIPRLFANLKMKLSPGCKVLLCVHKIIEHLAPVHEPEFASWSMAHYGAIDGRNDWHDHDAVVVFGMPNRDDVWSTIVFFAIKGLQSDNWLRNPEWPPYKNVHQKMQRGHLAASIIQAINRVRCRHAIDADGNCPPTDICIVLRNNVEGSMMLRSIREAMPAIVVKAWAFEPDGPGRRVRAGTSHARLIEFMRNRMPGETQMLVIKTELNITNSAYKELMKVLRNSTHGLHTALANMGVSFASPGRGSRAFLTKQTSQEEG